MKKYQRMHLIFIRQYIKQIMEYKVDFVVGVLGVFLTQGRSEERRVGKEC